MRVRRQLRVQIVSLALTTAVTAACVAALPAPTGSQGSFEVYRVGGDESFPPFEYLADSGAYQGFNVDLMNAIAIELGIQIELMPMYWSDVRPALERGDICAIWGMKRTPERESDLLFSDSYLTSSLAIFVKSSEFGITCLNDLSGRAVAVQQADAAHERVSAVESVNLLALPDQERALYSLAGGAADAYVGNRLSGIHMAQKHGLADKIKIVGDVIDPMPYAMAFRPADRELAAMFNRGIAQVRASGAYDKIHAKWFGQSIAKGWGLDPVRLRLHFTAMAFAAAGAVAVIMWNLVLRKLSAAKTAQIAQVNALNQQILESSGDGIAVVDSDLKFVLANSAATRLMGWEGDSVVGVNISDTHLAPLVPRTPLRQVAGGTASRMRCDIDLNVGADTRVFDVRIAPLSRLMPADSRCCVKPRISWASGALLVFSDVTSLRHSEEIESTSFVMSALARSVSSVAAEVRNPLLSIREYLEQLPVRYGDSAFLDEISRFVPSQVARVDAAIRDLLVLAKPEPPDRAVFDLAACVLEALGRIEAEAHSRGIIIHSQLDQAQAFADRGQIADAVFRVIERAVASSKYMSEVEVCVRATSEDWAEVEVCDCVSLARFERAESERSDSAVDLFFRAGPNDSALGMAVSYRMLQQNGGLLTVGATPDGTRVKMRIPRGLATASAAPPTA